MSSKIKKLMEKYQDIFNIVKLTEDEKKEKAGKSIKGFIDGFKVSPACSKG